MFQGPFIWNNNAAKQFNRSDKSGANPRFELGLLWAENEKNSCEKSWQSHWWKSHHVSLCLSHHVKFLCILMLHIIWCILYAESSLFPDNLKSDLVKPNAFIFLLSTMNQLHQAKSCWPTLTIWKEIFYCTTNMFLWVNATPFKNFHLQFIF